jgi:hypothetical protein
VKYLKMFGLAAIVAAALAAFASTGTASATVLCSTTAEPCPAGQKWPNSALDFSVPSGGSFLWENAGEVLETCTNVTINSEMMNPGSATTTVETRNQAITWKNCAVPNTTVALGGLEIHKIAGTSNGTVTASEDVSWTINTLFFGSCVYAWKKGKQFGELTEGKPAILHVNSTVEKVSGSNFACPETGTLVGTMTLTSQTATTLSVQSS